MQGHRKWEVGGKEGARHLTKSFLNFAEHDKAMTSVD